MATGMLLTKLGHQCSVPCIGTCVTLVDVFIIMLILTFCQLCKFLTIKVTDTGIDEGTRKKKGNRIKLDVMTY